MAPSRIKASVAISIHQRICSNTLAAGGDVPRILTHKEGKEWASSPSLHWCGTRKERVGTQGIGIGGGTGAPPSALKRGFAEVALWFEPASDSRLPRIASDISQISFRTFIVTPFLSWGWAGENRLGWTF